jgi:TetR/AcrR family transcriptional regulator
MTETIRSRVAPRRARRGGARERRDPRATRQALLAAGSSLFATRGFDGVPIGELAANAGVNKALISYHFGGKRGLYRAILTTGFSEMAERVEAVEAAGGDARRALRGLIAAFASVREQRPEFPALFLREVLANGVEPAITPYLSRIVGVTRSIALRGMRQGVFRPVDPVALHLALFGSFAFFVATEPARERAAAAGRVPPMPEFRVFRRYLEELTLRGLRPDRSQPGLRQKGARA